MEEKWLDQVNMELLTRYINRELRTDPRVKDWFFSLDENMKALSVCIDYIHDFHSRDMYHLVPYDIDELENMFDCYYGRHLDELAEFMKEKGE